MIKNGYGNSQYYALIKKTKINIHKSSSIGKHKLGVFSILSKWEMSIFMKNLKSDDEGRNVDMK